MIKHILYLKVKTVAYPHLSGNIKFSFVSVKQSVVILRDADGGPLLAEVGQDLSLLCNYQVMGDSLYSIKWYRDDKEFFRYIPRGNLTYYS